jgi:hypothetical protein
MCWNITGRRRPAWEGGAEEVIGEQHRHGARSTSITAISGYAVISQVHTQQRHARRCIGRACS